MTLQEQQAPIDRRIVTALIEATPESWNAAVLQASRSDDDLNESMEVEISSPEGFCDAVWGTEAIYEALYALSDLFRKHGKNWRAVRYVVQVTEDGNWRFNASYGY